MGGRDRDPGYAIDDETAIRVTDGTVDVVSEGHWKLLSPLSATRVQPGRCMNIQRWPSRSSTR